MKVVLLEHPRSITVERCNDIANTPLSSCLLTGYTGAVLAKEGHEVRIIEGYLDRLSWNSIRETVRAAKPDILGVHMVYHWKGDEELYRFLGELRDEGLAPFIIAYGFYPTISHAQILQDCASIDAVVVGEPELPFAGLSRQGHGPGFPQQIPGIAVRADSGGVVLIPRKPVTDLDSLPFPLRTESLYRIGEVNILGSRGCYGRCTFCYINTFYGKGVPWRFRSPENIIAEIDAIIGERGARNFYFTDPNFFGPGLRGQERAMRIAELLKPRNIHFGIEGRVNDIKDETIEALVSAGLRHILIGLESGRDTALQRMNKMTTVAENEEALRVLRKHGIEPNVGFIMFEPDSTIEDLRTNFEFLKRNDLLKNLPVTANVLYHHQIILGGTEAYHELKRQGRLEVSSSSVYEGTTYFQNAAVAELAAIMREITNYLFSVMDGIWSGKTVSPPGSQEKYRAVNQMLVDVFEQGLSTLENGGRFDREGTASVLCQSREKISLLLGSDPGRTS
jgi:anaerobic magnesium-protoporphyrin IX monomethyl ester cyclase